MLSLNDFRLKLLEYFGFDLSRFTEIWFEKFQSSVLGKKYLKLHFPGLHSSCNENTAYNIGSTETLLGLDMIVSELAGRLFDDY